MGVAATLPELSEWTLRTGLFVSLSHLGGGCFPPGCCNSFVFEVIQTKFCTGVGGVKIS